jgi:hypothetical protein
MKILFADEKEAKKLAKKLDKLDEKCIILTHDKKKSANQDVLENLGIFFLASNLGNLSNLLGGKK